jgi:hypothetical protein
MFEHIILESLAMHDGGGIQGPTEVGGIRVVPKFVHLAQIDAVPDYAIHSSGSAELSSKSGGLRPDFLFRRPLANPRAPVLLAGTHPPMAAAPEKGRVR